MENSIFRRENPKTRNIKSYLSASTLIFSYFFHGKHDIPNIFERQIGFQSLSLLRHLRCNETSIDVSHPGPWGCHSYRMVPSAFAFQIPRPPRTVPCFLEVFCYIKPTKKHPFGGQRVAMCLVLRHPAWWFHPLNQPESGRRRPHQWPTKKDQRVRRWTCNTLIDKTGFVGIR